MKTRKTKQPAKQPPERQPSERELRQGIEDARKVWSQRIDDKDRASRAESIARRDLHRAAGQYVRSFTRGLKNS